MEEREIEERENKRNGAWKNRENHFMTRISLNKMIGGNRFTQMCLHFTNHSFHPICSLQIRRGGSECVSTDL